MKRLRQRERGIALLAVLMGVALMTLIVVDFTTVATLGYLSAANQANELRAYYLAKSSVAIGLGLLGQDARNKAASKNQLPDTLNDIWATPYPQTKVDGGIASLSIVDENRKININQMVNPSNGQQIKNSVLILERLFAVLGVSNQIIPALIEWISPPGNNIGGAGLDYYARLIPPYAPRNGPMPTIGDLKMVAGVDEATFLVLKQFLTVVPQPQANGGIVVNINTAPPEVIAALVPELTENPTLVKEIVLARMLRPFAKTTDVGNLPGVGTFSTRLMQVLTTQSKYFTISATGSFAGSRKMVYAVFQRQSNGTALLASWREE
ncbi:MAG TPA: type II secretion system minor pseudopilin GspK [Candidatus Binataceae bacterium]|nr:type II secretion system minor pseudopilin GspK [Candidatus Binataceae bacterium]